MRALSLHRRRLPGRGRRGSRRSRGRARAGRGNGGGRQPGRRAERRARPGSGRLPARAAEQTRRPSAVPRRCRSGRSGRHRGSRDLDRHLHRHGLRRQAELVVAGLEIRVDADLLLAAGRVGGRRQRHDERRAVLVELGVDTEALVEGGVRRRSVNRARQRERLTGRHADPRRDRRRRLRQRVQVPALGDLGRHLDLERRAGPHAGRFRRARPLDRVGLSGAVRGARREQHGNQGREQRWSRDSHRQTVFWPQESVF